MSFGTVSRNRIDDFILGGLIELPPGAKLKVPRHTLSDLMAIPLKPSTHYVRLIEEPTIYGSVDWDSKLPAAFKKYQELVERRQYALRPQPYIYRLADKLRFKLRKKLIQWKVIV